MDLKKYKIGLNDAKLAWNRFLKNSDFFHDMACAIRNLFAQQNELISEVERLKEGEKALEKIINEQKETIVGCGKVYKELEKETAALKEEKNALHRKLNQSRLMREIRLEEEVEKLKAELNEILEVSDD